MSRSLARSDLALLLANAAGPAAWTAHLLLVYSLVSIRCESPWRIAESAYHWATAGLAAVALAGLVVGVLAWREPPPLSDAHRRRKRWLASTAAIASATFLLAILFGELPATILTGCG